MIERVKERLEEENGEIIIPYAQLEEQFMEDEKMEKPMIPGEAPLSAK